MKNLKQKRPFFTSYPHVVCEDTSLGLMYKLPLEAQFETMSNAYNRYREYVEDRVLYALASF
ncbi:MULTISPECIES: hypothetical protein [spotted fever group]|uniref:Uncharacterized protein n=1 Tax=Rickettsia philipii (strain 364D) TaxID=481009 RepID=H6PTV9_RICP3|nr:hypothetical protein RSA_03740 [Rickettsia philipii str. 364D]